MNCEKIYKSLFYELSVESPVNKSFREGMQDTSTTIPVHNWFGIPPQSVLSALDKGISELHTDRDVVQREH